ncbi:MAG: hypothetical protein WBK51_13720 [Polaromonas sp.]
MLRKARLPMSTPRFRASDQLGAHVTSLAESGQAISDALDELLTRSWG